MAEAKNGEGVTHMGRGRQKAKHTKVARELKYFSPDTNYGALERELTGHEPGEGDYDHDKWSEYASESDEPQERSASR